MKLVFDTSEWVDHLRTGSLTTLMSSLRGRYSLTIDSVVTAELLADGVRRFYRSSVLVQSRTTDSSSMRFSNSTPEHDEYGNFFVANMPFLGIDDIERLGCRDETLWIQLNAHGASVLLEKTKIFSAGTGRMVVYADGKLVMAALVRGVLRGGGFSISLPCIPLIQERPRNVSQRAG